ncbi:MAG: MOSC N-terminal beta barrel domain-containing protein, partial [Acidobacteriota bacterium]
MYVKELWRYPVKSMRGERLAEVQAGERGLAEDRKV